MKTIFVKREGMRVKKILCILLAVLITVPSLAFAAPKGLTVDEYINIVKEDSARNVFLASAVSDYDNRKVFIMASLLDGTALAAGYSFKNSDIVECILISGGNKEAVVFLLSAMSDKADAQARVDDAATYINLLYDDILSAFSNEWSAAVQVNNYFLNMWAAEIDDNAMRFLWRHKASKLKDKTSADGLIDDENYPLSDVIAQLQDVDSAPASSISGKTELSSGQWTCPEHLPIGEYKVTPVKSASISVYRGKNLVLAEHLNRSEDEEIGRLVLESGDSIQISGGKLKFEPFK